MNTYITPLGEPARSAFGPLARRGSRTSTHSAERVTQFADSNLPGMRSSTGAGDVLGAAGVKAEAEPEAARLAASVAATPVTPGVTPPTMRVGTAVASAADCGK